jgi:dTDP-4-amino-4,6-dideoxygalactose transaminase
LTRPPPSRLHNLPVSLAIFVCEATRLGLETENIESRPIWKPMHMQPVFKGCECIGAEVAEDLFRRGLCFPSGTAMTEEDLTRIVWAITETARKARQARKGGTGASRSGQ